jgi:ADP-ribose pyrophosphatase YjhB (NUDIX family)
MHGKNSHCSYCGHPFGIGDAWPRHCSHCGNISFLNPIPVAVVLLPVDEGLIVIRRGIEPRKGMLALPGGYINLGESWQEAAAREVYEETGIALKTHEVREFGVRSADDGTLLIFALAKPRTSQEIPLFKPTDETTERAVLTEPMDLAFALHTEMVGLFFRRWTKRESAMGMLNKG